MSQVTNSNDMRIFDFDTLSKSFTIKDVSKIKEYTIPEENMPKVKDQGDYCCCVACVLTEILEIFNKIETGQYIDMSEGYVYGRHRDAQSTSTGMAVETALKSLMTKGSVPKDTFNLLLEMPEIKRILAERNDLDTIAIPNRIEGYCKIGWRDTSNKIENIKLALANTNIPLVGTAKKGFPENHCILLYGITSDGRVMYQNSWGKTFGDNGRATIPVEDITNIYMLMDYKVVLPFKDVPENAWFYKSVLHMYSAGYVSGKSETNFDPNAPITRAEICSILDRILKNLDDINQSTNLSLEERFSRIEKKLNMV